MKKLLVLLPVCLFIGISTVMAQPPQGGGQGQGRERMKQAYKDSLGLTDVQIDTVMAVQQEFQPQMMGLRDLPDTERQTKMKEINGQMEKRLGVALKDEALAKKVIDFNARARARRGNRPPGGGGNN